MGTNPASNAASTGQPRTPGASTPGATPGGPHSSAPARRIQPLLQRDDLIPDAGTDPDLEAPPVVVLVVRNPNHEGPTPTGTVTVTDGGDILASLKLDQFFASSAQVYWHNPRPQPAYRRLTLTYSGDASYLPGSLPFTSGRMDTVSLSMPSPMTEGVTVTVTAHVHVASGLPAPSRAISLTGVFGTYVSPEPVDANWVATFSVTPQGPSDAASHHQPVRDCVLVNFSCSPMNTSTFA